MNTDVAIILFLICTGYSVLVQVAHHKWPAARHYTFFEVVIGVVMVGIAASFSIGVENAVVLAGYFAVAGLPMCIGAIVAHVWEDQRVADEGEVKEHLLNGLAEE